MRRPQKDADLASLAGAYELLDQTAGEESTIAAAQTATANNADMNDESDNAEIIGEVEVDNTCFNSDQLDSVTVDIEHESRTFFAGIFGLDFAPDIGAHARACMGSPIEGRGLLPLGVQVSGFDTDCFQPDPNDPTGPEVPMFGQYCRLAFSGSDLSSGEGGFLRLFDNGGTQCSAPNASSGTRELGDQIAQGGASTTCYVAPPGANCNSVPNDWPYGNTVNYCVWPKTQTFNNPTQDAFTDLVSSEGACDALYGNGDGIDDWPEVVSAVNGDASPSPDTTFEKRDCDLNTDGVQHSPRLVDLVIIEQFAVTGNSPRPILAFASFYIEGCENDGVMYRDCDVQGRIGQASLYGFFMNVLNIGTIGAYNGYGQRSIALWE